MPQRGLYEHLLHVTFRRERFQSTVGATIGGVVIGTVACSAYIAEGNALSAPREDTARNEVVQLENYAEQARIEGHPWPESTVDLLDWGVIKKAKSDPWGTPYSFSECTNRLALRVCSLGPDRLPRTEDDICTRDDRCSRNSLD